MNITKCPECGRSFRGLTCPQCGYSDTGGSVVEKVSVKENLSFEETDVDSTTHTDTMADIESNEYEKTAGAEEKSIKEDLSSEKTVGKSPKRSSSMAFVKCNDCGKIYDISLEACPQCGCPTSQQPQMPSIDESNSIDVTKLLSIEEDKFEETKDIEIFCRERLSSSIDDLCQSLQAKTPTVFLSYHIEKGVGQLQVCYFEYDLLKKIESIHDKDLADKYGWACRRMIINIDDKENIRLDLENNESIWDANFPITQEQFLKCCNAKKLEFKITKENGESIIVKGYYDFDPETGAEIDVNGDVVPENDLILNFQTLYNYTIDSAMFTDALRKRQMYDDLIKRKNVEIDEEVKKEEVIEGKDNNSQGGGWLLFGILSIIVGIILLITGNAKNEMSLDDGIGSIAIGAIMLFLGIYLAVYGGKRMKGLDRDDALKEMLKSN